MIPQWLYDIYFVIYSFWFKYFFKNNATVRISYSDSDVSISKAILGIVKWNKSFELLINNKYGVKYIT